MDRYDSGFNRKSCKIEKMDKKQRVLYDEVVEKLALLEKRKKNLEVKHKTLNEAEEKLRAEYEKKELYEQKEVFERYFKRVEYKEKVEKQYEDFFRECEE